MRRTTALYGAAVFLTAAVWAVYTLLNRRSFDLRSNSMLNTVVLVGVFLELHWATTEILRRIEEASQRRLYDLERMLQNIGQLLLDSDRDRREYVEGMLQQIRDVMAEIRDRTH